MAHSGPAQVPMMSPNGSVPPIYVPPGYAPQVCFYVILILYPYNSDHNVTVISLKNTV